MTFCHYLTRNNRERKGYGMQLCLYGHPTLVFYLSSNYTYCRNEHILCIQMLFHLPLKTETTMEIDPLRAPARIQDNLSWHQMVACDSPSASQQVNKAARSPSPTERRSVHLPISFLPTHKHTNTHVHIHTRVELETHSGTVRGVRGGGVKKYLSPQVISVQTKGVTWTTGAAPEKVNRPKHWDTPPSPPTPSSERSERLTAGNLYKHSPRQ